MVQRQTTNNRQAGFSAIELIIALALVAAIGIFSAIAYRNSHSYSGSKATPSPTSSSQTYADKSGVFTLSYPNDWKFVAKGTKAGGGEYGFNEFIRAANYPTDNSSILMFDREAYPKSATDYVREQVVNRDGKVLSTESTPINGYDAATVHFEYPSGNPTGYHVSVVHNGQVVNFEYYDYVSADTPVFRQIINSIKFTK